MINDKDLEYLRQAIRLGAQSPDESTKLGAILVNSSYKIIGQGVNGFPVRVNPRYGKDRYHYITHAERASIFNAVRHYKDVYNSTLYCPWVGCADCCNAIIECGISRVVTTKLSLDDNTKWVYSIKAGHQAMREVGIQFDVYDGVLGENIFKSGRYIEI